MHLRRANHEKDGRTGTMLAITERAPSDDALARALVDLPSHASRAIVHGLPARRDCARVLRGRAGVAHLPRWAMSGGAVEKAGQRQRVIGKWSSHEDSILVREYNAGGRWRERAEHALGRTSRQVLKRLWLLRSRGVVGQRPPMARTGSRRAYSPFDVAEMRRMAANGARAADVAKRLDRTRSAIETQARRLGISFKRRIPTPSGESVAKRANAWTEYELIQFRVMLAEGTSYAEIARDFGRSHQAVSLKASRLGLTHPPRSWQDSEDHRLRLMYLAGISDEQIAHKLGRTRNAVSVRRNRLGLIDPRRGRPRRNDRPESVGGATPSERQAKA